MTSEIIIRIKKVGNAFHLPVEKFLYIGSDNRTETIYLLDDLVLRLALLRQKLDKDIGNEINERIMTNESYSLLVKRLDEEVKVSVIEEDILQDENVKTSEKS